MEGLPGPITLRGRHETGWPSFEAARPNEQTIQPARMAGCHGAYAGSLASELHVHAKLDGMKLLIDVEDSATTGAGERDLLAAQVDIIVFDFG